MIREFDDQLKSGSLDKPLPLPLSSARNFRKFRIRSLVILVSEKTLVRLPLLVIE